MTDITPSSSTEPQTETSSQRSRTDHVTEYVVSWKWLLGGLAAFLCCGSVLGGLYYYRSTNLAGHVLSVASQMVIEADEIRSRSDAEPDAEKKRELFLEARKVKEDAAKLLDNFNRAQEGHTPILKELNSILESLYKDEGGADAPGGGRERSRQIMDNCVTLIQAIAEERESLPYRIRLMELAWDRRDLDEVLDRAREVLDVERKLNNAENMQALRYVALASLSRLSMTAYNPILLKMPNLEKDLDKLLEKVYNNNPADIEIAEAYAEFIIDVNRDTFRKCASDELLRNSTPEKRKAMATAVINDMVSRNPNNLLAYLTRFQFRMRFLGEDPHPTDLDPDLKEMLRIKPTDSSALIRAAMYTLQQRDLARKNGNKELAEDRRILAERYLKELVENNKRFGLGYQYYGDYLVGEGKRDEALKIWDEGFENAVHPYPEELLGRLAQYATELKRFEDAQRYVRLLHLMSVDSRIGRAGASGRIRNMARLLEARLNAAEGTEAAVKAEQAQAAGRGDESKRLYSLSRTKLSTALTSLDDVLRTFGSQSHDYVLERTSIYSKLLPESLMLAGKLMQDLTKWGRAAKYFEVTIPFPVFREAATVAAANAYQQNGQPARAVQLLADAVQRAPENMFLRNMYMRSLFQQQMTRNDVTPEGLDNVEKQLRILEEHRDQLPQPWTIDLRMIQIEMLRATITNDPERILEAQLAATRRYRELENKEFPTRPGDEEDVRRVYADDLGFLNDLANVYRALAAISDFDRILLKMRDMPGGETAYFGARVNDALGRGDREGAKLVIEEALESDLLNNDQKQRFVLLMRNLNEDTPDSMERIYSSLKASYDINPDQLKPQAFFLLANMAIDRDDFAYAKLLQERLERIEGAPENGTWWRYIKARIMLAEPEPDFETIRRLQEDIVTRDDTWDQGYLLRSSIEEKFLLKDPDNREARTRILESLQMAIRCGNTHPQVWNKLVAMFEEDKRTEEAKQLRRDALVRGIMLDSRVGTFPQPYQRMYVQVQKSIQDEDPQNADLVARQCIVLAESRNESPKLIFDLNFSLGSMFFEADMFESASRHLQGIAKYGGRFVQPLAVCLAKEQRVDEGFNLLIDEMDRMPSSMGDLIPAMLILLSQVRPSEEVFVRMDRLMERIQRGERRTLRPQEPRVAGEEDYVPLGTMRIHTMVLRFPESEITPDPADITTFPPEDDIDDEEDEEETE